MSSCGQTGIILEILMYFPSSITTCKTLKLKPLTSKAKVSFFSVYIKIFVMFDTCMTQSCAQIWWFSIRDIHVDIGKNVKCQLNKVCMLG